MVTEKGEGYVYAEHPGSRFGIRINTLDTSANEGDYIYVRGKVGALDGKKVIEADSVTVITGGWGKLPPLPGR